MKRTSPHDVITAQEAESLVEMLRLYDVREPNAFCSRVLGRPVHTGLLRGFEAERVLRAARDERNEREAAAQRARFDALTDDENAALALHYLT